MSIFSKIILLTNLEHLTNILVCFVNTHKNLSNVVQVCECTLFRDAKLCAKHKKHVNSIYIVEIMFVRQMNRV